ncbi:MAG: glutathione synthase [Gammaproteobacteria bacterium]|nr:glutathione synthase [Gammaproteobacteria bacterium]
MSRTIGIVMDPISEINIKKDSSFAMLLAAQRRGWIVHYMELPDIRVHQGIAHARTRELKVREDPANWFEFGREHDLELAALEVILMRKDPPFDMEFVYATYALERAEEAGCLVVNKPSALRDCNEKFFTAWFAGCTPETLITRDAGDIRALVERLGDIIVKPLDGMGGASIFRIAPGDANTSTIIETLTAHGSRFAMAQQYIPQITDGDKRVLMLDGEPLPYALARVPAAGELRGNLAAGAQGVGRPLTEHDRWIAGQVGPELRRRGLLFVGLDVIGEYLTEINVTSPTCIRELDGLFDLDIGGRLMDVIDGKLNSRT